MRLSIPEGIRFRYCRSSGRSLTRELGTFDAEDMDDFVDLKLFATPPR